MTIQPLPCLPRLLGRVCWLNSEEHHRELTRKGGYNLQAISDSALAVGQVLLGEPPAELPALQASEVATEVMHQVAKIQSEFWKSIDVKACEPPEVDDTDEMPVRTSIPGTSAEHRHIASQVLTREKRGGSGPSETIG